MGGAWGGGGGHQVQLQHCTLPYAPLIQVSGRFAVLSKLSAFLPPSYKTQKMRKFRPKKWTVYQNLAATVEEVGQNT